MSGAQENNQMFKDFNIFAPILLVLSTVSSKTNEGMHSECQILSIIQKNN